MALRCNQPQSQILKNKQHWWQYQLKGMREALESHPSPCWNVTTKHFLQCLQSRLVGCHLGLPIGKLYTVYFADLKALLNPKIMRNDSLQDSKVMIHESKPPIIHGNKKYYKVYSEVRYFIERLLEGDHWRRFEIAPIIRSEGVICD